ncbi:hypothetical protein Tco_1168445, partial [Tanacetum coccineum]
ESTGPLINIISRRSLYPAGLSDKTTVAGVISDGNWTWPQEWFSSYPSLFHIAVSSLQEHAKDRMVWRNYGDDVVFMGQWSESNINTLTQILDCFHRASGLHINMNKSKLLGIALDIKLVDQAATKIGCTTIKTPFSYLGSTVGGNMSQINSWEEIIRKVESPLFIWKLKTLSIGGRLTLLKYVLGSIPIYHMSLFKVPKTVLHRLEAIRCCFFHGKDSNSRKPTWLKWNKILVSKEKGGLGVSSFFSLNRALICKWVWRFRSQNSSLWAKVIKSIHGFDGKLDSTVTHQHSSIWIDIVREVHALRHLGIDLDEFMKRKLGDGNETLFWEDTWKGDKPLKYVLSAYICSKFLQNRFSSYYAFTGSLLSSFS